MANESGGGMQEKHEKDKPFQLKRIKDVPACGHPENIDSLVADNDPIKDYKFLGWSRDPFATTPEWWDEQLPTNVSFDRNVHLYGVWSIAWCWVKFNPMGGQGVFQDIKVRRGSQLENFPTVTRDGYRFLGWCENPRGGISVTSASVITNDTTLFAQWEIDWDMFLANMKGNTLFLINEGEENPPEPVPKAPLLLDETRFPRMTGAESTNSERANKFQEIAYPQNAKVVVYTRWVLKGEDAAIRHTAHDGTQVACATYHCYSIGAGTTYIASNARWIQSHPTYRVLWYSEDGGDSIYKKYYRQIDILPARNMLKLTKYRDYVYPDDTQYPPVFQYLGHGLVRWFVMVGAKHLDGTRAQTGQSEELRLEGRKDFPFLCKKAGFSVGGDGKFYYDGARIENQRIIDHVTSFVPSEDSITSAWLNVTDYTHGYHSEGTYKGPEFTFYSDIYPIV